METKEHHKNLEQNIKNEFFEEIVGGEFPPDNIEVNLERGVLKRSEETKKYIDEKWQEFEGKKLPSDEEPTRYHFVSAEVQGDSLSITLDPSISYKEYIGARGADFREKFGEEYQPKPLAVAFMLTTSDNKLVLTRRKVEQHDYKAGGLHTSSAGFITFEDKDPENGVPIILDGMFREVEEEIGVKREEVGDLGCLGIYFDPQTSHPDIVFRGETDLKAKEIVSRRKDKENIRVVIENDEESVKDLIMYLTHAVPPPALALLARHGKDEFGDFWYEEVMEGLELRGRVYKTKSKELISAYEKKDTARIKRRLEKGFGMID